MQEALNIRECLQNNFHYAQSERKSLRCYKEIMKRREGLNLGSVRKPLPAVEECDLEIINEAASLIDTAIAKYCK